LSEPTRIAYFVPRLEIGGTERQLVQLVEGLDKERYAPSVVCNHLHGGFLPRMEHAGIPLAELPIRRLYGLRTMAQQLRFASYLRKRRIDIMVSACFYANVFAIPPARLARTPVVIGSVREQGTFWTPAQRRANYLSLRWADCVTTNAVTVRRTLLDEGFPPERVRLVPNGVEVERFALERGARGLRQELGFGAQTKLVVVTSRLAPGKGVEDFLDAAAAVARVRSEARFVIVGDGGTVRGGQVVDTPYRRELERRAAELGIADRVRFVGYRLDVPEILAQADVAVVPSLSEALSNSLLEAMAAGAPVVTTDVGDSGVVVEDGATGLVVPPGDPWALATRMLRILGDEGLGARLGDAARRRVRERLSVQRMVKEMECLYEELLARARRPMVAAREGVAVTP
jgi:L-malate glycosyltransferase